MALFVLTHLSFAIVPQPTCRQTHASPAVCNCVELSGRLLLATWPMGQACHLLIRRGQGSAVSQLQAGWHQTPRAMRVLGQAPL